MAPPPLTVLQQALVGKDAKERHRIKARAHFDADTPRRWRTEENVLLEVAEKRYVEGRGLWVLLESDEWEVDPDGYYFVNPPTKHENQEDVDGTFRVIVTEAARYYHTHPEVWGRTTTTVYGVTGDDYVRSNNATYSTARAGTGTLLVGDYHAGNSGNLVVGQATGYHVYQSFIGFDTSSIPDTDDIDSAILSLDGDVDASTTNFTVEVFSRDWGTVVEDISFVAGATLSSLTLVATWASSGYVAGYNDFTENGTNLRASINKTGTSRYLLASFEQDVDSAPTNDEYVIFVSADEPGTTADPKLVINHTAGTQNKSGNDTGSGSDTSSSQANLSPTDIGSGSDTTGQIDLSLVDSGIAAESEPVVDLVLADTGTGSDASVSIEEFESKEASDTGSGVDTSVFPEVELLPQDTGTGSELVTNREIEAFDSGTGDDVGYLYLFVMDSGNGVDTSVFPSVTINPSDSGTGSEDSTLTVGTPTFSRLQWRVVIGAINGAELEEVPAKNLQVTWQLNGPGSVSFVLPLQHPKSLKSLLDPGKREIHVYRGSNLVWGGYLWVVGASSNDPTIRVSGEGFFSRLRRRVVSDDLEYEDTEQFDIAWNLIAYTQAKTGGNLGITRDPGEVASTVERTRRFHAWNRTNIGEFLEDYSSVRQGFDFEITPQKVWKVYHPRKGDDTGHVIELGKNIEGIAYEIDASDTVSTVTAIGSGQGRWTCIATVSDATALTEFGLLEDVISFPDIKHYDTLENKAQRELDLRKGQRIQPEASVVVEDPPFEDYDVGDLIRVKADLGYIDLDRDFRAITKTAQISDAGRESVQVFFDEDVVV